MKCCFASSPYNPQVPVTSISPVIMTPGQSLGRWPETAARRCSSLLCGCLGPGGRGLSSLHSFLRQSEYIIACWLSTEVSPQLHLRNLNTRWLRPVNYATGSRNPQRGFKDSSTSLALLYPLTDRWVGRGGEGLATICVDWVLLAHLALLTSLPWSDRGNCPCATHDWSQTWGKLKYCFAPPLVCWERNIFYLGPRRLVILWRYFTLFFKL